MSLPAKPTIQTLDYSYLGQPWVRVTSKAGIDVDGLDVSYLGQPWWGVESGTPLLTGTTAWGHVTGVTETNVETFADNWLGTGAISGSGDAEVMCIFEGEYMESNVVATGATTVTLIQNNYAAGDTLALKYRHGATEVACLAASWTAYTVPFVSAGYVQLRVEYN